MLLNLKQMDNKSKKWSRIENSVSIKMLLVAVLILILLIPLSSVKSLIRERRYRQKEVVDEINSKWGNDIYIYGPMLKVPYKHHTKMNRFDTETKKYYVTNNVEVKYAYIFPDQLNVKSDILSEKLNRGNYESVVYKNTMSFKGVFDPLLLKKKQIKASDIIWNKISLMISTSNLKGIQEELFLNVNNYNYPIFAESTQKKNGLYKLQSELFAELEGKTKLNFDFNLVTNGSNKFEFVPVGKVTTLSMKSNWENPSFIGNYLPRTETKKMSKDGFSVDWKILQANRPFSQIHLKELPNLKEFAFGTKFMIMANEYQKIERTSKYGLLVIALTFVVFFIIQITSKINIHPFQYLMIGFSLLMFYTLLISISEHSNYLKAYLIAALAVISLISFYAKFILKSIKLSAFIASALLTLYGFIYVVIQLENYSLLVGSIGLFIILSIVMYTSRNIDFTNKKVLNDN